MIVVQVQIEITSDRINAPIFVLAREDATDDERTMAYAVEQWVLGLQETVARESGLRLDVEFIGPQHEAERATAALVDTALTVDGLLLPADSPGVSMFVLTAPERRALERAAAAYRSAHQIPAPAATEESEESQ